MPEVIEREITPVSEEKAADSPLAEFIRLIYTVANEVSNEPPKPEESKTST